MFCIVVIATGGAEGTAPIGNVQVGAHRFLETVNFAVGDVINYSIYLKKKFNCKIDVNIFMTFIDFMNFIDYFYDQINDGIKIDSKKRNYF